ncbi:MAG: Cache 3/Cache 2 fusion domain-containing protein, partial [Planctomycetota bacterium]
MGLRIQHKILAIAALPPVFVALPILSATSSLGEDLKTEADSELTKQLETLLTGTVQTAEAICTSTHVATLDQVEGGLSYAKSELADQGGIAFDSDQLIHWSAMNQLTKQAVEVELPRMLAGDRWFGQDPSLDVRMPVVDKVRDVLGATVTVFQRINEEGDMLRVATNVAKKDGTRAIGTYIPAIHPDGSEDPVISQVMAGETFVGEAFVVNDFYLSAYEALRSPDGDVVGMIYVGVKRDQNALVRNALLDMRVGESGYIFVLGGKGDHRGHYVLSKNGERDGEDILHVVDAEGTQIIKEMVERGVAMEPGEVGFISYYWQNKGEAEPRRKTTAFVYFPAWDWVIGAGMYDDEGRRTYEVIDQALAGITGTSMRVGSAVFLLVLVASFLISRRISRPLRVMAELATSFAEGDLSG